MEGIKGGLRGVWRRAWGGWGGLEVLGGAWRVWGGPEGDLEGALGVLGGALGVWGGV